MTIPANELKADGLGSTVRKLNAGGGGDPAILTVAITTTNAVPTQLFQHTLDAGTSATFRATIVAVRRITAATVGKFVREFTVKRLGAAPAILLQDLVPSVDYQEDAGLAAVSGVDASNAVVTVTGLAATLDWHGRVEIIS